MLKSAVRTSSPASLMLNHKAVHMVQLTPMTFVRLLMLFRSAAASALHFSDILHLIPRLREKGDQRSRSMRLHESNVSME